ncbi:uncharacterized protein EURHEDRAFT_519260 [Aspergillus ruber CBS 135680]|uniref:Phosphoribosyltransferase domain-containing protein n=1 Tax=Aspergillus ruber (strain CBS 135680) TaxID=1388766 RepID=A0A017S0W3_ASPRC|nr:uncharacterized protein EURHEDRAFT_519260 [Aspergillus ruber CBS 135680]EYE90274.1 hypothetical protein EURHEDRAFT_519260 [Aspergillus ruber CBS 135680]
MLPTGATKLLITPMRDATAHRRAGWSLANEFLTDVIGFEKFLIPHVQGHNVGGYQLLHQSPTLIAALMQGGKPMAFGVNNAFPRAMFLHADHNEDITSELLKDRRSIILVDLVTNSGKSILQFVEHIHNLHATIHIVIVAGVVQSQSVCSRSSIECTTDTGNHLFNTVDLS